MINMDDVLVKSVRGRRLGMQPVETENDVEVWHLPTGLIATVPHGFTTAQDKNLKIAMRMIMAALEGRI